MAEQISLSRGWSSFTRHATFLISSSATQSRMLSLVWGVKTSENCWFMQTKSWITSQFMELIGDCQFLAHWEYIAWHNNVAKILLQRLALDLSILAMSVSYFKYTPQSVLERDKYKLHMIISTLQIKQWRTSLSHRSGKEEGEEQHLVSRYCYYTVYQYFKEKYGKDCEKLEIWWITFRRSGTRVIQLQSCDFGLYRRIPWFIA